jgi:hypothetical protein
MKTKDYLSVDVTTELTSLSLKTINWRWQQKHKRRLAEMDRGMPERVAEKILAETVLHREVLDYERGKRDCEHGEPHQPGQSERYNEGYSDQYAIEQRITA